MGKNTLIRRCIKFHAEKTENNAYLNLLPLLVGNVGLIFTKGDLKEVSEKVAEYKVGFDALYFSRIDYQDREKRKDLKTLEVIWRGSRSLGSSADIFTGIFPKNYEPHSGNFYFEVDDTAPIVQDDPLLFDYNDQDQVNDFVAVALSQVPPTKVNTPVKKQSLPAKKEINQV